MQTLRSLSATALTTYLRCPKQFYYKYIERLQEPAPDESISASELTIGNALHAIMEQLYAPFVGSNVTASQVEQLMANVNDDAYWNTLQSLQLLNGDVLANRVVRTYVNNILINDHYHAPFQYIASEMRLTANLNGICLYGIADRIDVKANILRVIDYKTGKTDLAYDTMSKVFGVVEPTEDGTLPVRTKGQRQILQTLLYCWMSTANSQLSIVNCQQPYIYSARNISPEDIPVVHHNGMPLSFSQDIRQEFVTHLQSLINEILDANQPFAPTNDTHTCESCAFFSLCHATI